MLTIELLQRIGRDNWPLRIQEIAGYLGDDLALTLFINYAGRHLAVPLQASNDSELENLLGKKAVKLFCYTFGGEVLQFPNGKLMLIKLRNPEILKDWVNGMTQAAIATKYYLTERQINKIIYQQRTNPKRTPSEQAINRLKRRNKDMRFDYASGMTKKVIAEKYYLSDRSTKRIIGNHC
ncbi:MAG: Mor transcription activator family protein [Methylococcaceae bacterium]